MLEIGSEFWHDMGPEVPQLELNLTKGCVELELVESHPSRDDNINDDSDIARKEEWVRNVRSSHVYLYTVNENFRSWLEQYETLLG